MSYPYFYNEYLPSNRFPNDLLVTMKTNNDDYIANKAMYRELEKIKLLVLGQNNLYGSANHVIYNFTYTKTSISGNDYFGTLMQKLSVMFPGCFIYYTRGSDSHDLTFNSIKYPTASSYVPSTVSITNVLFISQTELTIPSSILDGQLKFSYNYLGTGVINSLALANIPLIFVDGVFYLVGTPTITISGTNSVTVTVNIKYDSIVNTISDFGLTFKNKTFFEYDNGVTNINIMILNNIPLSKTGNQFFELLYISIDPGQNPIIRSGTSLASCFSGCTNFDSNISGWDVTNVIDMSGMFDSARAFTSNISGWDTSNVTNMSFMFCSAIAFNSNISDWKTTKVTNMSYMFFNAGIFNQPIGIWDTSKVTNMYRMFSSAFEFNQSINYNPTTGSWNTSNVIDMSWMFANDPDTPISKFNQDIGNWITTKVTNMSYMFYHATAFNNGDYPYESTKKMNWTFNNLPTRSRWHFNSALTYDNAPTVLQDSW
jgi:surface protein